jgi:hypothetical protein
MRAAERELLIDLFGGIGHPLASRCAEQMLVCSRFTAFLDQYRSKVRKKARTLEGPRSWPDLWLELWTAARLLADRRFEVAYETYTAQKVRGPDLTATFRTHVICHVEIKHVRAALDAEKWAEVLCAKLGQCPPGAINVLLVGTGTQSADPCTVELALRELSRQTQRDEHAIFQRAGMPGARDFARQMARVSGVLHAADWDLAGTARQTLWQNPTARHALPPDLARALLT